MQSKSPTPTAAAGRRGRSPAPEATPLPQVPSRWWEALLIVLACYLDASVVAGLAVLLATGVPDTPGGLSPMQVVTVSAVTSLLALIALLAYVGLRGKQSPLPLLGFRRGRRPRSAAADCRS